VKKKQEEHEIEKQQITSLSDIYKTKPVANKEESSSQASIQKKHNGKS
jgi:hypothetical protein